MTIYYIISYIITVPAWLFFVLISSIYEKLEKPDTKYSLSDICACCLLTFIVIALTPVLLPIFICAGILYGVVKLIDIFSSIIVKTINNNQRL